MGLPYTPGGYRLRASQPENSMNPTHKDQLSRLNRAIGQLQAVGRMIEDERYCVDILTQLRAARSAVKSIELGVLEAHMNSCVSGACASGDDKLRAKRISEIMELLKKYE